MTLRGVPLDSVTEAHLRALVSAGVAEGREIEFKLELPGGSDADKKEFLADVCSFANAGGGDILYGVKEACAALAVAVSPGRALSTIALPLPSFSVGRSLTRSPSRP